MDVVGILPFALRELLWIHIFGLECSKEELNWGSVV